MKIHLLVMLLGCGGTSMAFAQACEVTTRAVSHDVPVITANSCYEFKGMPANAIDWSCSNQSKDALATEKVQVKSCKPGNFATCRATLTQESLANPLSTSKDRQTDPVNIPDAAEVVTYYYDVRNQSQARIDCEQGGGRWETP
ncbi:hypothetical protein D9M71_375030 [compost metagenome]